MPETEQQGATSESDDDVPVAMLLKPKKAGSLTLQQIQECKNGPEGDKAVGKTVAKIFVEVKFTGIIDRFRTERKRHIYHMTYSDGDEEEWSQRELRDGYVLGLAPEIEARWKTLKEARGDKDVEDRELNNEEEASDGEGILYAASSDEETCHRKSKRCKDVNVKPSPKRAKRLQSGELSGLILPRSGDKSVAREVSGKLTAKQKTIVAANVNKKTMSYIHLLQMSLCFL